MLTFNALMRGRVRDRLRALGPRLDHDLVCLQEVLFRGNLRLFAGAYPHRFRTGSLVLAGGLVILSRWPLRRCRFVPFPVTGPPRPEMVMRKGAQIVEVATPGGPLTVVNTHLSANRDGDWSPGNRYTRIERRELDHLATVVPAGPVVVAGDFNVPRDSPLLRSFTAALGLLDATGGDGGPTYRPTAEIPSPAALDQVLVRGVTVTGTRTVFRDAVALPGGRQAFLSDHYGVEADLVL